MPVSEVRRPSRRWTPRPRRTRSSTTWRNSLDELVAQQGGQPEKFPTVAEIEAQIETRNIRRGAGSLFASNRGNMKKLTPMPKNATLLDFFKLRFDPANHVLQSATRAMKTGMSEEIILACLCHDVVLNLIKPDHGWWGAQLFEPYVPEKTTFAIRYHQTLRFYPDPEAGYEYPGSATTGSSAPTTRRRRTSRRPTRC